MRKLLVLLDKEFRQFFRSSFLPKMVVMFPLMIMLVIPWVTTMDVKHINVSIVDNDYTTASRRLIQKIAASDYFSLQNISERYETSFDILEKGKVDVIVEIPDGFEQTFTTETPKKVNISTNGVNTLKGSLGAQYMVQTVMQTLDELRNEQGLAPIADFIVEENRYNPELEYRNYMIPALMIMLLLIICGELPSINLVDEKEKGTIEQINVTPISRLSFTLSKLIPYWIIGCIVLSLAMLIAKIVYGLWPCGSVCAIYLAAVLFILSMSGIGVTIANKSDNKQQAMLVIFFFVMIFVLMSGLITPIESMPSWAQGITYFLPPRYLVEIMRAIYLKGTTIGELLLNYGALVLFAIIFNILAAFTYKKQI